MLLEAPAPSPGEHKVPWYATLSVHGYAILQITYGAKEISRNLRRIIILSAKVRIFHFSNSHIGPPWPVAWPRRILSPFILPLKVRKTPDFFQNPVFFMVAEAGLEPTTSGL